MLLNFNQYFASDAESPDFLLGLCMSSTTYAERQLKDLLQVAMHVLL